jgi:FkbM family methyltransferase
VAARAVGQMKLDLQRLVAAVIKSVPQKVQLALRGRRGAPSQFATSIHKILNRLPGQRYLVLECTGALDGYRMMLDWNKDRSFAYGTWEPEVVNVISKSVSPGMTALDLGSYGGFFTLLLSQLVGPKGRVIAFEPLPANFRVLEENVRLNSIENVTVERLAVSSQSGEFRLDVPSLESPLLAGPFQDEDDRGTTLVPATSLDDYIFQKETRVDFIKIDVEGAEDDVLRGAQRTLATFHPTMVIELHNLENEHGLHPAVADLEKSGYELQRLSEALYTTHILARWQRNSRMMEQ